MMVLESSHWLLIGFFVAGLLDAFGIESIINRNLKDRGWKSVLRASALGIPLPLCSCSVIPIGVSIRRKGASAGATASFFISTPQIGVDSFLLTWGLLGPVFGLARVIASFCSAVLAGITIDSLKEPELPTELEAKKGCCSTEGAPADERGILSRVFRFGFVEMVDDLAKVLALGFLFAGLAAALIPSEFAGQASLHPALMIVVMFAISIPVYVCATSSTPFAAVLIAKGISPGAALVFLLAGPATNISTVLALKKELGLRATAIYICSIVVIAVVAALIVDYGAFTIVPKGAALVGSHSHEYGIFYWISALILSALLISSAIRKHTHTSTQCV